MKPSFNSVPASRLAAAFVIALILFTGFIYDAHKLDSSDGRPVHGDSPQVLRGNWRWAVDDGFMRITKEHKHVHEIKSNLKRKENESNKTRVTSRKDLLNVQA